MASNVVEYILDIKTRSAEKNLDRVEDTLEGVNSELKKTEKQSKKSSVALQSLKKVGPVLKKVGVAVAAMSVALVGSLGVAIKKVNDLVNELNDLSVRSGLSTKTIAGLRFALVASGQQAEGLNEILGAISNQFAQLAKEGSEVEKKLNLFGISVKDTSGKLKSNNEILLEVIKNISDIEDPSERARRAVFLVGEAGAKLNQALAAGNFDEFVALTQEFGVRVGPNASKQAANMQVALSALNTVFAGTTQRLTESIGGTDRFIQILHVLISVMAGVGKVIENNSVFLGHLTNAIFEASAAAIDFFAGFLTGTKTASKGLLGLSENIFIVGQAILRGLLIPIQSFIFYARQMSEFLNLDMTQSLKNLEKRLQETHRNLNITTNEGLLNFIDFSKGADKVLNSLSKTTGKTSTNISSFSSDINKTSKAVKELNEEARDLNDVINDLFSRFVKLDIFSVLKDASIILNAVGNLGQSIAKRIGGFIKKVGFGAANVVFEFLFAMQDKGFDRLVTSVNKLANPLTKLAEKFSFAIGGSIKIFSKGFNKLGDTFSKVFEAGAQNGITGAFNALGKGGKIFAGAFGAAFAAIGIAKGLGERGDTPREIQKSVEQDIRATAKAIEMGLRVLPGILFETLPPLLLEFVDRLVFGFLKGIAEQINLVINAFKSIFTREGRQERKENRGERREQRGEEFQRRLQVLFDIISKRSGGRYIPSARGGIRFTGNDEGLAMLHRGEYVVPETGQAPQGVQRTMMGMGSGGVTININAAVVESNAVDELVRQIERRFSAFGSSTSPLFGGS